MNVLKWTQGFTNANCLLLTLRFSETLSKETEIRSINHFKLYVKN